MAALQTPETMLVSPETEAQLPPQAQILIQQVAALKYFLISAPVDWPPNSPIRRCPLITGDSVTCVYWDGLYHISGTDIVRCLAFRFHAFGRPVKNAKKFEEGVFSDLRNLKAGTDATLEEPKSPFLDFLYKNNCIRTQKKQKVFYWYSVPHDRLFLDALERDLKREKAGQEVTTAAEREPALGFEYDGTTSLFEQLTKTQQAQASSYHAPTQMYSHSTSPVVRAVSTMPPPPTVLHAVHNVPEEAVNDFSPYSQTPNHFPAAAIPTTTMMTLKKEPDQGLYNQQGAGVMYSLNHASVQQASMPPYVEYSPAPSFNSSQSFYEDYSTRTISFEPVTPPQQALNYQSALIPHTDNTGYGAVTMTPQIYQRMVQMNQNFNGQTSIPRSNPMNSMYSHIEGSPTYKSRGRRSPFDHVLPQGTASEQPGMRYAARRPSDLRRSVSATVVPTDQQYHRSASGPTMLPHNQYSAFETPYASRQGTPIVTVEQPHNFPLLNQQYGTLMSNSLGTQSQLVPPGFGLGAVRRARSATTAPDAGPYSIKSHSCPILECGRVFKRLEHLKRHVRTHTNERAHKCPDCHKSFSRSDNLAQHRRIHESGNEYDEEDSGSASEIDHAEDKVIANLKAEDADFQYFPHRPLTLNPFTGNASQFQSMAPPTMPMTTSSQHFG